MGETCLTINPESCLSVRNVLRRFSSLSPRLEPRPKITMIIRGHIQNWYHLPSHQFVDIWMRTETLASAVR